MNVIEYCKNTISILSKKISKCKEKIDIHKKIKPDEFKDPSEFSKWKTFELIFEKKLDKMIKDKKNIERNYDYIKTLDKEEWKNQRKIKYELTKLPDKIKMMLIRKIS